MDDLSIHDSRVVAYEVDCERRRIVLHTRRASREQIDVTFEGVVAYRIQNDNFGNILFSIREIPIHLLVSREEEVFQKGSGYAWPGPWNESSESAIQYMESKGARAFEISSSYGLTGWVVCSANQYRLVSPSAAGSSSGAA